MNNLTFAKCVADAEALLRLGQARCYLESNDPDLPWGDVHEVDPSGGVRGGITVTCWFAARHSSGLVFRWSVDIEPHRWDGNPSFGIDAAKCREVLGKLPKGPAEAFAAYLRECIGGVDKRRKEFEDAADRQRTIVEQLREAVGGAS